MLTGAVRQQLAEAIDPDRTLRLLRENVHLTYEDIARGTGTTGRSVRRWAADRVPLHSAPVERLDDLRAAVQALSGALSEQGIVRWLRGRNAVLGYRSPLDALADGDFEEVLAAIDEMRNNEYL
jgi:hypothetical protein